MSCTPIRTELGTAIVCSRGRRGRRRCTVCLEPATRICDGTVDGRSCDAPLCSAHAVEASPGVDHCPECARFDAQLEDQFDLEAAP